MTEKQSNVSFGSKEFTQTVSIRTAVLGDDELCERRICMFDAYRLLKFLFIVPHYLQSSVSLSLIQSSNEQAFFSFSQLSSLPFGQSGHHGHGAFIHLNGAP